MPSPPRFLNIFPSPSTSHHFPCSPLSHFPSLIVPLTMRYTSPPSRFLPLIPPHFFSLFPLLISNSVFGIGGDRSNSPAHPLFGERVAAAARRRPFRTPATLIASTRATCSASRCAPSWIWCRHEVPSATMMRVRVRLAHGGSSGVRPSPSRRRWCPPRSRTRRPCRSSSTPRSRP